MDDPHNTSAPAAESTDLADEDGGFELVSHTSEPAGVSTSQAAPVASSANLTTATGLQPIGTTTTSSVGSHGAPTGSPTSAPPAPAFQFSGSPPQYVPLAGKGIPHGNPYAAPPQTYSPVLVSIQ